MNSFNGALYRQECSLVPDAASFSFISKCRRTTYRPYSRDAFQYQNPMCSPRHLDVVDQSEQFDQRPYSRNFPRKMCVNLNSLVRPDIATATQLNKRNVVRSLDLLGLWNLKQKYGNIFTLKSRCDKTCWQLTAEFDSNVNISIDRSAVTVWINWKNKTNNSQTNLYLS